MEAVDERIEVPATAGRSAPNRSFVPRRRRRASPIRVRHVQFLGDEHTLPDTQLWGVDHGALH